MKAHMNVLDALGLTREDMADIAAKRERHLRRVMDLADEAVEHVRHAPGCPSISLGGDEHCNCGAVDYLNRLGAAIRNETER